METTFGRRLPSSMSPMAVPNYRRFFVAQCSSSVGTWFRTLAIALLAVNLHGTASSLGIVVALQWLPLLVLGPYAGALIDRRPTRTVLVATNLVSAGIAVSVTVMSTFGALGGWALAVAAIAFGFVLPFDRPAVQVLPVELVPAEEVPNAIGLSTTVQSFARLVGPALGGVVLAGLGPTWCFAANAVMYLLAAGVLVRLDRAAMHPRARPPASTRPIRDGVALVMGDRRLRAVVAANAWVGLVALNFLVVITAIVELDFGAGDRAAGFAHSVNAAGALVAGALVGAWVARFSRRLDIVCAVLGLALAANALAPSLAAFLALGPLLGAALVIYQSSVLHGCYRLAGPDVFGRVSSLLMIGTMGTTPIGAVLMGAVIDAWSGRVALGLGAGACAIGAIGLAVVDRRAGPVDDPVHTVAATGPSPVDRDLARDQPSGGVASSDPAGVALLDQGGRGR